MTEIQLDELIDELNSKPESSKFILTQIAVDIFFGKVWFNLPWENQTEYQGDKYYFINKPDYGFIGLVEASNSEMHAYLKPDFRGNGIMSLSLRETILPHLFWYNKTDTLRITIDQDFHGKRFEEIQKSALLAGFKNKKTIVDGLFEYYAIKNEFPEFKLLEVENVLFSKNEFQFLQDRINSINAQLQYMKERYELMFNEEDEMVSAIHESIKEFETKYYNKLRSIM